MEDVIVDIMIRGFVYFVIIPVIILIMIDHCFGDY